MFKKLLKNIVRKPELSLSSPTNYDSPSSNKQMAKVTIDGKDYDTDTMTDNAKKQLASLQFSANETNRLEALLAVTKTAQAAYTKALQTELENGE
tara:strand:- start:64 stop:348 length:285 start_codon:yes stop_codon:yes gene_type:complete